MLEHARIVVGRETSRVQHGYSGGLEPAGDLETRRLAFRVKIDRAALPAARESARPKRRGCLGRADFRAVAVAPPSSGGRNAARSRMRARYSQHTAPKAARGGGGLLALMNVQASSTHRVNSPLARAHGLLQRQQHRLRRHGDPRERAHVLHEPVEVQLGLRIIQRNVTAGAATRTNKQRKRWAYLWGKQTEVSRWCANRGVTRGSAVRLQAGRSLAKRCIEGGLQVRRRSEQKNKSALSGSDRGSLYTCGGSTIHYL